MYHMWCSKVLSTWNYSINPSISRSDKKNDHIEIPFLLLSRKTPRIPANSRELKPTNCTRGYDRKFVIDWVWSRRHRGTHRGDKSREIWRGNFWCELKRGKTNNSICGPCLFRPLNLISCDSKRALHATVTMSYRLEQSKVCFLSCFLFNAFFAAEFWHAKKSYLW